MSWVDVDRKSSSQSVGPLVSFKEQRPRQAFPVHMGIFILFTPEPDTQVQKATSPLENPGGLAQPPTQAELNRKPGSLKACWSLSQMDRGEPWSFLL